jgi:inner membrane protein
MGVSISPAALWALVGVLLVLSEFVAPGIIAVFFGLAALIVAAVLALGVPLNVPAQILLFAGLGLCLLLLARGRLASWFQGDVDRPSGNSHAAAAGTPVTALTDFVDGLGTVSYRGARWNAESPDPIAKGERAWITGRRGLVLMVSRSAPSSPD